MNNAEYYKYYNKTQMYALHDFISLSPVHLRQC